MEPWQFSRLARVTSAYDEARARGEKHSVAVRHAVEALRRCRPKMRISETGVKRILATYRPRGSETILLFERSPLSEEDIKKYRLVREKIAGLQDERGITLQSLPTCGDARRGSKFTIRYAARPDYPRHNRRAPNE